MPSIRHSILFVVTPFAIASCIFFIAGCSDSATPQTANANPIDSRSNRVVVVSYPLLYLTQRVAGDLIEVNWPVSVDTKDPQNWRPTRDAISKMQSADLIFANGTGATYAKWLTSVTLPDSKVRNTASKGLSLSDYIAVEDVTVVHSHGPEGEHSHPTMIARTWLDPAMAKKQAIYIASELSKTYPENADRFSANLKSLNEELTQLSEQLKALHSTENENAVILATPNLKFFTRAAGIGGKHLTWFETPGREQANADLKTIFESDDAQPRVILFDNALPNQELVEMLQANGLKPVAIDLIDQRPESGDFLSVLKANIELVASALGETKISASESR